MKTTELICESAQDYIRWPVKEALREISRGFRFPDTVGRLILITSA